MKPKRPKPLTKVENQLRVVAHLRQFALPPRTPEQLARSVGIPLADVDEVLREAWKTGLVEPTGGWRYILRGGKS